MNALFVAAREVCEFMKKQKWKFCIIGGLAVQRWGEMRTTLDSDISLFTGFGQEERFADELLAHFQGRRPDARAFALRYRVLLVQASNGKDVDVDSRAFHLRSRSSSAPHPLNLNPESSCQPARPKICSS